MAIVLMASPERQREKCAEAYTMRAAAAGGNRALGAIRNDSGPRAYCTDRGP